ncbi:hypothetical protein [Nonomuraea jiangxiensis]|uniref:hypothetical protein n=1 Tax=Nonomuraea jiangxiensis TaxID=633440 RepID=UPI00115FB3B6|nr:hypothetical protein [Nonomuraea jiangxiensis]
MRQLVTGALVKGDFLGLAQQRARHVGHPQKPRRFRDAVDLALHRSPGLSGRSGFGVPFTLVRVGH